MKKIKSNILIAEFDDNCKPSVYLPDFPNEQSYHYQGGIYKESELKYHKSWDWLMPVVEKIQDIKGSVTIEGMFTEDKRFKTVFFNEDIGGEKSRVSMLDATYKAIVKFIKWYNKQNKNEQH